MADAAMDHEALVDEFVGMLKLNLKVRTSRLGAAKDAAERAREDGLEVEGPTRNDGCWEVDPK